MMRPLTERIVMDLKKKFAEVKTKIKDHAPEIALAAIAVTSTVYAIVLKQSLNKKCEACSKPMYLALGACCLKELEKGEPTIWNYNGHIIDLAYDPDCAEDTH
ncbi:hypothetical protein SEA_SENDITCS_30 [Streptomyces phage SendItCS]|nr:hypothetical protein SEA_SENDITCS_30 [Streptomyces phage SendItCS]